jgi:hypothetical protein
MHTIHSTLTEEEKWYFDLHGFLVLRNVIPKDEIEEMLKVFQQWLTIDEADIPPPLVPGSHKSLFQTPANLPVKHDPPTSITLPMEAGDVAIFSTNLLHDASPWTEDYPRMNIFQRYQLSAYFNETGKGGYPFDEHRDKISDAQYELESLSKEVKAAVKPVLPK